MSATDELRKMLDERGIKHFDYSKSGWSQTQWEAPDGNRHFTYETYNNQAKTAKLVISWFPTPEQAIAATLGSGTLTAEQVREAIFNGSSYASYDGAKYYADGISMQAIADELNATLGGGECEVECFDDGVDEGMDGEWYSYASPTWYLSCGHDVQGAERPNYCVVCGMAVKR